MMDVPMPPEADFEDDGTATMDAPSLARGLRACLQDESELNAELQDASLEEFRTYLDGEITGPVREALVQNGVLRPCHDYADQAIYAAGSDPFLFTASLWSTLNLLSEDYGGLILLKVLDQNMLPTANIHDDLASRLRCWLPQERNLDSRATDLRRLRRYISSYPRPREPLLGAIFFEGQLKYFANTRREKREDETIYDYIAALWGALFSYSDSRSYASDHLRTRLVSYDADMGSCKAERVRRFKSMRRHNILIDACRPEEKLQRSLEDTFVGDGAEMLKEGMKDYHSLWDTFLAYYGRLVALVAPRESSTLNPIRTSEQQEPQHDHVKQEPLPELYYHNGSIKFVTSEGCESIDWMDEYAKPKYEQARDALVAAVPWRILTAEEVEELMQDMADIGF
ncbi:hypothetical protein GGX14DRAFT_388970 [Mycena pura]|uniref:Uncharacterized protein n=1 Tax=Mycena pura TaxID=153505 RepID=A0AAD6VU95_9AGAR|nr:hypothetical protein GGX14DRAFT_388970 [Mycena pura]